MEEKITSLTNKKIKSVIRLLSKKEIEKSHIFLSFEEDFINEANKRGYLKEVYSINKVKYSIPTNLVSKQVMEKIKKDANIVGVISFLPNKIDDKNNIIYLDEIRDPSNLGKIILLAAKYNHNNIILSKECTSLYNEKCLEIAKDNIFKVNFTYGDISTIKHLKDKGYQIVSTGLKSSTLLSKVKLKNKYVIIFGNEAKGVNENILNISDLVIKIPIKNIDSLNVSVAAAIVLDNL